MKVMFVLLTMMLSSVVATSGAMAEQSINDRDAWLEDVMAIIKSGRIDELTAKVKTTLGTSMEADVASLIAPLSNLMAGHPAIYVDKIDRATMGESFDQHIFVAYYGERTFLFYSFTFARLENGWQLYALDYADSLAGLQ